MLNKNFYNLHRKKKRFSTNTFFSLHFDLKCESNCAQPKIDAVCFESYADFINELNTFWGRFSNSF